MLLKNYFFCLIGLLFILQSCSSSRSIYYAPEESNMLKLAQENDIKAAVSTSQNIDDFSQINAQIAYSPIKHLGIFGNFLNWNNSGSFYNSQANQRFDGKNNYKIGSAAIGGYYLLQTEGQKMRDDTVASLPIGFLFDVYTGIGRGRVKNEFSPTSDSFLKFNKTYSQIGIHWQDEYVGLSMVYRFGQLNFIGGVLNGNSDDAAEYFLYLRENQKQKFRETSFKLFMGTKEVRGYVNVTIVNLDRQNIFNNGFRNFYSQGLPSVQSVMSIGVALNIDNVKNLFKKSKN